MLNPLKKGSKMELKETLLSKAFTTYLEESPDVFKESLELITEYSQGKIWLMGSYLYGNFSKFIYGKELDLTKQLYRDIDFLAENVEKELNTEKISHKFKNWDIRPTSYGSFSFVKSGRSVDLNYLFNFYPITLWKRSPNISIEDILESAPLNIQSILYDCSDKKLLGKVGISAVENKIIKINHKNNAKLVTELKLKEKHKDNKEYVSTSEEILKEINKEIKYKAEELGFEYESLKSID